MSTDTDIVTFEELVADQEIPCDIGGGIWPGHEHDDPARWVAMCQCPECGMAAPRLLCDGCKELFMSEENGVYCRFCDSRIVPAYKLIVHLDAL